MKELIPEETELREKQESQKHTTSETRTDGCGEKNPSEPLEIKTMTTKINNRCSK